MTGQVLSNEYLCKVKASLIDSSVDFMGIADVMGNLIYLNDAAYRMMGYGPTERPVFHTIADIHANDFATVALREIQPAVFEHGSWAGIGYLKHKDGHAMSVSQLVFPVFGEDGTAYGTAAVMKDLSALEQMNEKVQKNSELFQKIMDSAKIGIVLINMESRTIEMVNKCTCDMLQRSSEQIIGQKCYEMLCHRDPALCPHVNERETMTLIAERFLERADGSLLPIIKTGTWIKLDDKDYLVDTFADISIQKELEKKLVEAKSAAEAANRSKSEFLSRMSHEMRTPLNAIIGMTQIAERAGHIDKLRESIQTIGVSSKHLLGLINDVLDLSKIEEGKLELNEEPFSLPGMLEKIQSLVKPKVEEKKLRFDIETDEDIPQQLAGDGMRLSQVLLNFLSNAVKFTPERGQVSLGMRLISKGLHKVRVCFSVGDTGIGMTQEQVSRLFTPFTQADSSIAVRFGGTGLGLTISQRIVNLMGGDIQVETASGKGTVFSFTIDLAVSQSQDAPQRVPEDINHIFKGKRALVVDDVELNRLIAMELLADTDLEMDEAQDGREAVERIKETPYDIVFMDVKMPVMDGYEATRQIRALPKPVCDVPIVAMSGNVFKEDVDRSLLEGMNAHIGKPIDLHDTIAVAARFLLPDEKPAPQAVKRRLGLRKDYRDRARNKNLFDCGAALALCAEDEAALALDMAAFLEDGAYAQLEAAMAARRYEDAQALVAGLRVAATRLFLPGVIAYASNVAECLRMQRFEYAGMYLADLGRAQQKVSELFEQLLEEKRIDRD